MGYPWTHDPRRRPHRPPPGHHIIRDRFLAADSRLFDAVATRDWPGAHPLLPRLSREREPRRAVVRHGGGDRGDPEPAGPPGGRRGASPRSHSPRRRSTPSASARCAARRPVLDTVPLIRQLKRQPITTSFPSGHSASAAAFATGVALESRGWGAVVAPLAACSVALSRVYTGVHFPSDVLVGAALGVGAAFAVRGVVPTRDQLPPPGRPHADAPALPDGDGLVVVVNRRLGDRGPGARPAGRAARRRDRGVRTGGRAGRAGEGGHPRAGTRRVRRRRHGQRRRRGGPAPRPAARRASRRHAQPLRVRPRRRGRARPGPGRAPGRGRPGGPGPLHHRRHGRAIFLNTFSLGVYPELVRERERWSPRIGGWPAGVLAALRVLRADRHPLEADVRGQAAPDVAAVRRQRHVPPDGPRSGPPPSTWPTGCWTYGSCTAAAGPALRLLAAAVAGPLTRSPAHAAVRVRRLQVDGIAPGTLLAYDGEVTEADGELTLREDSPRR